MVREALTRYQRGFRSPRGWQRTLPIPHPPWAVQHPPGVVPAAVLGCWRCPHQRCPCWLASAGTLCPALPCPARGEQHARPGHPRARRGLPSAAVAAGRAAGQGGTSSGSLARVPGGWRQPQARLCVSHVWGWGLVEAELLWGSSSVPVAGRRLGSHLYPGDTENPEEMLISKAGRGQQCQSWGCAPGMLPAWGKAEGFPRMGKWVGLGTRIIEHRLCVRLAHPALALRPQLTPPARCRWLLWIFPFLIKSHQVGFPSRVTFLPAPWGARAVSPVPGDGSSRAAARAGPAPQPSRA